MAPHRPRRESRRMKHVCVGAALYYGIAALADVCVRVYMITICAVLCDLCAPAGGAGARERDARRGRASTLLSVHIDCEPGKARTPPIVPGQNGACARRGATAATISRRDRGRAAREHAGASEICDRIQRRVVRSPRAFSLFPWAAEPRRRRRHLLPRSRICATRI